jgi:muramoyltetrapeptide carboxypeptidase
VSEGIAWLEGEGYAVRCAEHLHARQGYLAGSDAERLSDLLSLVDDPEVEAIVLARGGYGVGRILRQLDPQVFRDARKIFVGYSDATLLLSFLRERSGLASIYGPMLDRDDTTREARDRLLSMLRGDKAGIPPLVGCAVSDGRANGPLVGGNLTLVAASLGTPWEVNTRGAILFLEEVNEEPYHIDRMLVQLRDAGKLREAAGLAFGSLVECESERYPEPLAGEVVRDVVVPEVQGPVVFGLPFGHVADNHALAVGVEAELDGQTGALALLSTAW